jgi:hypothetical protein
VGRTFDAIDERLAGWIAAQPLYFVGTAPLAGDGHVNISPKGPIGTLRVLGPDRVAYLDLVGSGAETVAHLRENGRIVVMLCAFAGPPRIVRLHGTGTAHLAGEPRFAELLAEAAFDEPDTAASRRAVIEVSVSRIAESCGYGVPVMDLVGDRPHLEKWAAKKVRVGGAEALEQYQAEHNAASLDGLPAVPVADPAPTR